MIRDLDCQAARAHLLGEQRRRLDPETGEILARHLEHCPGCAHEERAERLLTEQLELHLPQHAASFSLKRSLAGQFRPSATPAARKSIRWPLLVAGILLSITLGAMGTAWFVRSGPADRLVTEAVNDHLRVLAKGTNLDIQASDVHQVRPWLTARLDFAPIISFQGDAEFPLRGGGLEYFLDRRAAVVVYGRRLHTVTLIVTRADGMRWPEASTPLVTAARGFHVRLWKRGDLAYALVSDVDPSELGRLAARLGG